MKVGYLIALLTLVVIGDAVVLAGSLNPPAPPSHTNSAMYTLEDIYNRLDSGAPGAKRTGPFTEPGSSPGDFGHTLDEIMQKAPQMDNAAGAGREDVLSGKRFWGLRSGAWGVQTGTMPIRALSPTTPVVQAGYYVATNLTAVDPDLASGNIRSGITLFGITGKKEVVDTTSGNAAAGDIRLGRKAWVNGLEVTGSIPEQALSPLTTEVAAGIYQATNLSMVDSDLVFSNIRANVVLFGITGKTEVVDTSSGTITAADVITGKVAWSRGVAVTGSIPMRTLSAASAEVAAGYYGTTNLTQVDADLASGNIRAGVTIFGVSGAPAVVDTSSGNAGNNDLLIGKLAWVNGAAVTGSIPMRTLSAASAEVAAGYYGTTNLTQVDADLASGNIRAGVTIFGVSGAPAVVDTSSGNAGNNDLLIGKLAWVNGAAVTGSIPVRTLSAASAEVAAGYYGATNLTQVDADLASGNIRAGVTIFGVTGAVYALVPKTGQKISYRAGDDGALQKGVAWPAPRFVVQPGSNTVLDNLTGLMWTLNANIISGQTNWDGAVDFCRTLNYAGYSDWRLPNRREMLSLIDDGQTNSPVLPAGHPFTNVQSATYWTSTTYGLGTSRAWGVSVLNGYSDFFQKTSFYYVWPVRGGM